MRICPKCGHVDPIWWRPAAYHPEFDYAHLEALEAMDLELYKIISSLRPGELTQQGPYLYWKSSRSETVRRVWIEDYKIVGKRGSPQERVHHYKQAKLELKE